MSAFLWHRCRKCSVGFDYQCLIQKTVRQYLIGLKAGLGGLPEIFKVEVMMEAHEYRICFETVVFSYVRSPYVLAHMVGDAFMHGYHESNIDLPVLCRHALRDKVTIDVTLSFD